MPKSYSVEAVLSGKDNVSSKLKNVSKNAKDLLDNMSKINGKSYKLNIKSDETISAFKSIAKNGESVEEVIKRISTLNPGKNLEGAFVDIDGTLRDFAGGPLKTIPEDVDKADKSFKDLTSSIMVANLAVEGLKKVWSMVSAQFDSGMARVDTLNQYPKVLGAIGIGADQADASLETLVSGIDGLPTKLDEIAGLSQRLTMIFQDANKASKMAVGMNNFFLASGADSADASRGMEQYLQMLQTGTVDMAAWKSITETAGVSLSFLSKELLGSSANSMDLYQAMRDGIITFDDFNDGVLKLNNQLSTLAVENTKGWKTSIQNITTAVTKGVADSIQAMDQIVLNLTGKSAVDQLDSFKGVVKDTFGTFNQSLKAAEPFFGFLLKVSSVMKNIVEGSFKTFTGGLKMVFEAVDKTSKLLEGLYNNLKPIHPLINALGQGLSNLTTYLTTEGSGQTLLSLLTTPVLVSTLVKASSKLTLFKSEVTLAEAGMKILGKSMGAFSFVAEVFTGKVNLVTSATTLLKGGVASLTSLSLAGWLGVAVAGMGALYYATTRVSKETNNLASGTKNLLTSSSKQLSESKQKMLDIESGIIEMNKKSSENKSTTDEVEKLLAIETKSSKVKEDLADAVGRLNEANAGLNLSYDAEKDTLNQNVELSKKYISTMDEAKKITTLKNSKNVLLEDNKTLEKQGDALLRQRSELEKKFKNIGAFTSNTEIDSLKSQYKALGDEYESLGERYKANVEKITTLNIDSESSVMNFKTMLSEYEELNANTIANLKVSYDDLTDYQKDLWEGAIDQQRAYLNDNLNFMGVNVGVEDWDVISTDTMLSNMTINQQQMDAFADQLAKLRETVKQAGVSDAIFEEIAKGGAKSIPMVQRLYNDMLNQGPGNLINLADKFANTTEKATEQMGKSFGIDFSKYDEALINRMNTLPVTLSEELKNAGFENLLDTMYDQLMLGMPNLEVGMQNIGISMAESQVMAYQDTLDALMSGRDGFDWKPATKQKVQWQDALQWKPATRSTLNKYKSSQNNQPLNWQPASAFRRTTNSARPQPVTLNVGGLQGKGLLKGMWEGGYR